MPLQLAGVIEIPGAVDSAFDHGAFEPTTGRVFVAHTARNCLEVIDSRTRRHVASLEGFSEAAGVVADAGQVLVTNRGSAELVWLDATTLKKNARFKTAPRPNGVAIVARSRLAVAACIGDDARGPELQVIDLAAHRRWAIPCTREEVRGGFFA
jgi:DNA-binding beta-propeller fold protein YncE